jgi:putative acyl-CoA dehydrogenase
MSLLDRRPLTHETHETHEVTNQPPPLDGYDLFGQDAPLREAVEREGGAWGLERLRAFGTTVGGEPLAEWGPEADRNPPRLRTHDRYGVRIDDVAFHPAWTSLLRLGIAAGVPSLAWSSPGPGSHVVRGALLYLLSQAEAGVGCPLSMTFASIPALRHAPGVAAEWEPRLLDTDPGTSALCGMAMTEKQGGSDVRANTTRAEPIGDGAFELTGHKWFCSHPVSDAFLVLAQAPGGLTCFLLPRVLPGGTRNAGFRIVRLKDKLGTRSLASGEVEFDAALAWRVGDEGRGVRTIIEMVNHTRLDCVLGSASNIRRAVAEATHHAAFRSAFGRRLIDQPPMANVLADLCVESEAATLGAMRLARAFDEAAAGDAVAAAFQRIATPVLKFWVCKRATPVAVEALEVLGGNGYVEDSPMPRLLRDSPLNSIWEGSGNVIALDVLRAIAKEPAGVDAIVDEISLAAGVDGRFDAWVATVRDGLTRLATADPDRAGSGARDLVGRMALALQGSLLLRHSPSAVAEAFVASRLTGEGARTFGTIPWDVDVHAIVERHRPRLGAA